MKKNRLFSLVALGVMAAAAPARAQTTSYCYGSQLWTCFSYQLQAVSSGTGTDVTLSIRNESIAAPGGAASWITAFAIYSPSDVGGGSNMHVTTNGTVGVVNGSQTAASEWNFVTGGQQLGLPGSLELVADGQSTNGGPKQGSVNGCGNVSGPTIYFNTCAPNTGWVVFNFHTTGAWSSQTNQFVMGVKWQTGLGSFECTSGAPSQSTPSCNASSITSTVTPEPMTIALLGTGLFGMGGAGYFRRRRRDRSDS